MDTLPTPGPVITPVTGSPSQEERTFGLLVHLAALSQYVGLPFGNVVGPLILWLVKKDSMPFVDRHGKEAVNFNISVLIYGVVSGILTVILVGFAMLIALALFHIVVTILAAIKAHKGEAYRYPLSIRFIK